MISWVTLLYRFYLYWPRWVRKKVMNWFSEYCFLCSGFGAFHHYLSWIFDLNSKYIKGCFTFSECFNKKSEGQSPVKHLWCLEGFKSHKNKQVQKNYEIPVIKRNKDSTAFFALLRIRIILYCKIQTTVLNRNRSGGSYAV